MKTLGCVLSVLAGLTALAHLQAFQVSRFAGTWHGKANGLPAVTLTRSEERRVGKECRSRWSPYH